MIGLLGLIFKYLGKYKSGIQCPSENEDVCSGLNGFSSIPDAFIKECSFSWAEKTISNP